MERRHSSRISDEIPTSSMADIAFLLIIYFMVTSAFTATRGLDFGLPDLDEDDFVDPVESVLVEVHASGALTVDSQPMLVTGLLDYLAPRLAQDAEKPVIVQTDSEASYGSMVRVMDELRQGRERLGLAHEIVLSVPT
ncbi:MAG: biopolymer transporter ExbD, partial [Thermoanaerobaculia bacterium]|nr:biopolymer transporter ExbD [Thermoanaerobaculia bacterium]